MFRKKGTTITTPNLKLKLMARKGSLKGQINPPINPMNWYVGGVS